MIIDPIELDLELFGPKCECAEHTEAARIRHGSDDISTMRKGKDWKFNTQTIGKRSAHGSLGSLVMATDHVRHKFGGYKKM